MNSMIHIITEAITKCIYLWSSSQEKSANRLRLDDSSVAIELLGFETKIPNDLSNNDPLLIKTTSIVLYDCMEISSGMLHHVEEVAVSDKSMFIVWQSNHEGAAARALNFERKMNFIVKHGDELLWFVFTWLFLYESDLSVELQMLIISI